MDQTEIFVGLDYSMTGPAMTVCEGAFHIDNCKIFFMTGTKKYCGTYCNGKIIGVGFPEWKTDMERFNNISNFFMKQLEQYNPENIRMNIEGYAMGATGRVFNIAENTAIMKYKLFLKEVTFGIPSPTSIKKMATGSGRAKKPEMYEFFEKETCLDLRKEMMYTKKEIGSPIGDIVDSYFICKSLTVN